MIAIEDVPRALIPNHMWTRILRQQFGPAMTTTQQPSQQGLAIFDRSPHPTTSRIFVMGNHRLITLINVPVNVAFMVIQDQYRPFLAPPPHLAHDSLLSRFQPLHRLATPIGVRSGIDRVLQHTVHRMIPRWLPDDFTRVFGTTNNG